MIPNRDQLEAQLMEDLEIIRFPGPDGQYERLHPWAIKAVLRAVDKRISHILDYAVRYERLAHED